MQGVDVAISGAGVVGLSIALDLRRHGLTVCVIDRATPGSGASRAAAGMLAAHDPGNPPELLALAERSISLYPAYLHGIAERGGGPVPFETEWTLEHSTQANAASGRLPALSENAGHFSLRREWSLDPRKLLPALLSACLHTGVSLLQNTAVLNTVPDGNSLRAELQSGGRVSCDRFVDCRGAWAASYARPVKGQMLRVKTPADALHLPEHGNVVVRTPEIYLVPRLDGTCLIGATVEDAGFDTGVVLSSIQQLRREAAALVPALADAAEIESWAGLRPGTRSGLPVLGRTARSTFVANGLYRNGILLAPVVAATLSAIVRDEAPEFDLTPFAPEENAEQRSEAFRVPPPAQLD